MAVFFDIRLEPHHLVYYPGYPITGYVHLVLSEPKKMRAIYLEILGEGNVYWTEQETVGSGENTRTETETYSNNQKYIEQKIVLQNLGGTLQDSDQLPAGTYSYPFSYTLPPHGLPASFEGAHGSISYYLKAVLDIPWGIDKETKQPFVVNAVVDLNQNYQAKLGVNGENSKQICCWFCAGGNLQIQASLPKSGYVMGETLLLKVDANNSSNDRATVKVKFNKKTTFYARGGKSKIVEEELLEQICGEVRSHDQATFSEVTFVVPAVPPTDLGGCQIINISYQLKCILAPEGCFTRNLELDVPLILGTIPIPDYDPSSTQYPTSPMMVTNIGNFNPPIESPYVPSQAQMAPYPLEIGFKQTI